MAKFKKSIYDPATLCFFVVFCNLVGVAIELSLSGRINWTIVGVSAFFGVLGVNALLRASNQAPDSDSDEKKTSD